MVTVRGVVERVGPTVLRAVVLPSKSPVGVIDVVIAETSRQPPAATGDLVLAVGIHSKRDAAHLVKQCGHAAAVLFKPPLATDPAIIAVAKTAGVALIEVSQEAAWAQLVWLLRTVLDAADTASGNTTGDGGFGDLFRLADAIAAVIDAPVTIEDANSRVLAYSARQDRTDQARVSTIMGRKVPADVLARFRSRGVFRQLSKGQPLIFVPAQPDGTLPRLIVPIRMGGELLGSMWAVVTDEVDEQRASAFADTGSVVALHLLRRRARLDTERQRTTELVRAVLTGTTSAPAAAAELGLVNGPHRVLAIDAASTDLMDTEGFRLVLGDRMTRGVGRRPAIADLEGTLYAIVPDGPEQDHWSSLIKDGSDTLLIAVGRPATVAELPTSRAQADEVLGLLRARRLPNRIADYDGAWLPLILHRASQGLIGAGILELGPLSVIRNHDEAEGTSYVATLFEWLRHPGDPKTASMALQIHPNTFRYRLRKITELTGLDLDDPNVRLALLCQLLPLCYQHNVGGDKWSLQHDDTRS